eukprot:1244008-Amphidinium_carterae.2
MAAHTSTEPRSHLLKSLATLSFSMYLRYLAATGCTTDSESKLHGTKAQALSCSCWGALFYGGRTDDLATAHCSLTNPTCKWRHEQDHTSS